MRRRSIPVLVTVVLGSGCSASDPGDGSSATEAFELQAKVAVCHIPPTAPESARTMLVTESALSAHLAHGDTLGTCGQVCTPGSTAACYAGPSGTEGVGACSAGTQTCSGDGSGYGDCVGQVTPASETCGNSVDDDCDGQTDETCVCLPTIETCGNAIDDDCDGQADEGCLGDRAWTDSDADGIQDDGEPGLAGVTFFLRQSATGALVAVTVSNVLGAYYFSNVPAGSYYIEASAPVVPGGSLPFTQSDAESDTLDGVDSDFDIENAQTQPFEFSGAADYSRDCGFLSAPSQG